MEVEQTNFVTHLIITVQYVIIKYNYYIVDYLKSRLLKLSFKW